MNSPGKDGKLFGWKVHLGFAGLVAAIPLILVPLSEWSSMSPRGSGLGFVVSMLMLLCLLPAGLVFVLAVIGVSFDRTRRFALVAVVCCMTYVVALFGAFSIANAIQVHALGKLADRSRLLVASIKAYEMERGHPPESLEALVPNYISEIPNTGIGAWPEYHYRTNKPDEKGRSWMLYVDTPNDPMSFSMFIYCPPTHSPPPMARGGMRKQIKDWVHDSGG